MARDLGNQLIAICRDCINALADRNVTHFHFHAKADEIAALLNIQMITSNKQQVRDLRDAALQLQDHCSKTRTIDTLDIMSTKASWDGVKAIDVVLEELNKGTDELPEQEAWGRAQMIINNRSSLTACSPTRIRRGS